MWRRLHVKSSVTAQAWKAACDHYGVELTPQLLVDYAGKPVNELFDILTKRCSKEGQVRACVRACWGWFAKITLLSHGIRHMAYMPTIKHVALEERAAIGACTAG